MEKTLLDGRQLSEEEFKKMINQYRVYMDINLVMIKDRVSVFLLVLLQHLKNLDNLCVAQSFLAKQLGCDERSIRRKLDKLKELDLIAWKSGAKNHKMNVYSINQEKYETLIATINTLSLEERQKFVNKLFEEKPSKKEIKKSIEMDSSTEKEPPKIVKTNYSILSEEKQKATRFHCSGVYLKVVVLTDKWDSSSDIKELQDEWRKGSELCDDFEVQVRSYINQAMKRQEVLNTFNRIIKEKIYEYKPNK